LISEELLGRIVQSKRGRDRGKSFVVIKVVNDNYVIVADGDLRKIDNPKLKNVRHLQCSNSVAREVLQFLNQGEVPPDHIIKKSIKQMLQTPQSTGEGGLVNGER
jgi:hypothetical protein